MTTKIIFFLFTALYSINLLHANTDRYPFENAAYTGEILSGYKVYYEFLPLTLQLGVDPTFSKNQKSILNKAYKVFLKRSIHPNTIDCTYKNSTKDFPMSEESFINIMIDALSPKGVNGVAIPTFIFIANLKGSSDYVGVGYIGLYYHRSNPLPGYKERKHFYIGISSEHLGEQSDYAFSNDVEYWAGVIGHEVLHNLNFTHPSGYEGSFIKEFGKCIARISIDAHWRDHVVAPD